MSEPYRESRFVTERHYHFTAICAAMLALGLIGMLLGLVGMARPEFPPTAATRGTRSVVVNRNEMAEAGDRVFVDVPCGAIVREKR